MLEIGDVVIGNNDSKNIYREQIGGKRGIIIAQDGCNSLVEFDEFVNGHSGASTGKPGKKGHCWWIHDGQVTKVNYKFKAGDKVIIKGHSYQNPVTVVYVDKKDIYLTQPYLVQFNDDYIPSMAHNGLPYTDIPVPKKCLWFSEEDLEEAEMVFDIEKYMANTPYAHLIYQSVCRGDVDVWQFHCQGKTEIKAHPFTLLDSWLTPKSQFTPKTRAEFVWFVIESYKKNH